MNALRYSSSAAIVCIAYITILAVVKADWKDPCDALNHTKFTCTSNNLCEIKNTADATFSGYQECSVSCETKTAEPEIQLTIWSTGIFQSVPLFCFAFASQVCHILFLQSIA